MSKCDIDHVNSFLSLQINELNLKHAELNNFGSDWLETNPEKNVCIKTVNAMYSYTDLHK